MDRKGGAATVALLVAAVLGVSFLPRTGSGGGSEGAGTEQGTKLKKVQPAGTARKPTVTVQSACEQIQKRLERFSSSPVAVLQSCYIDPAARSTGNPLKGNLHFAIALVPNPIQTHLPLSFDHSIEAIQQAAQDNNYIYDSSWFPWDHREKSYERYADDKEADADLDEQQDQPGILVFRKGYRGDEVHQLEEACKYSLADPNCQNEIKKHDLNASYDAGLIVFVVGEQPTGGISDAQFQNALNWLKLLDPTPAPRKQLKILGPAFSGSLPSLANQLDVATLTNFPGGVDIYSGSVNSDVSVNYFKYFLEKQKITLKDTKKTDFSLDFRTFLESDSLMTNRFLCYLRGAGYNLGKVAILSEDETAFGKRSPANDDPGREHFSDSLCDPTGQPADAPIYLYYPRDIATLRSAYERQGIFTAAKKQATNAPSTVLRGDLSEAPGEEHDSVRTYAGQLTPLAQESVLLSIASLLQDKRVEFVVVNSTNSLDQLFISEFLRRSYPSVRVVLAGADLLFRRGMEGASLRGVILLSSYPLMPWTQDAIPTLQLQNGQWRFGLNPAPKGSYRIFSEDLAEGLYIAGRQLFPSDNSNSVPISDYAPPYSIRKNAEAEAKAANSKETGSTQGPPTATCWKPGVGDGARIQADAQRPLTWISVVGHRQFWPIAMLNSFTQDNTPNPKMPMGNNGPDYGHCWDISLLTPELNFESKEATPKPGAPKKLPRSETPPGKAAMPGEMVALLIFAVGFAAVWHAPLCWMGCMTGTPRARAYFAPLPRLQHPALIFIGSLLVSFFAITVAESSGIIPATGWSVWSPTDFWGTSAAVAMIAACGMVGLIANYRLPILPSLTTPRIRRIVTSWKSAAVCGGVWLLGVALVAWVRYHFLTSRLNLSNQVPTLWRNVHFRSGVSALLPQLILIAGLYAWFWFSLRGLALFGSDCPILPRRRSLPDLVTDPKAGAHFESVDDTNDASSVFKAIRDGSEMRGFRMFSQEEAGDAIEEAALPLTRSQIGWFIVLLCVSLLVCYAALGPSSIRTLGDRAFGRVIFGAVCFFIALILADTVQLLRTWNRLRDLLVLLDRLRLRRTVACLKGISWQSVWSMSGNVLEERYRMLSRQMESMQNLKNELEHWQPECAEEQKDKDIALSQLRQCEGDGFQFAKWYVDLVPGKNPETVAPLQQYQETLAKTAGRIMGHIILPDWMKERRSLILEPAAVSKQKSEEDDKQEAASLKEESGGNRVAVKPRIRAAEEFFILPYLAFIQNVMGRLRTIALSILSLFVAVTLAMSSYPFDPLPVIGAIFLGLFLIVGAVMVLVYAAMHRDATLSNITNTKPGELGMDFWLRLFTYGAGPVIALMTTLFPSITDFFVSFLQPGAEMMK